MNEIVGFVKGKARNKGVSLHTIWDGLITENSKYRENHNLVTLLMSTPEHSPDKFASEAAILGIEDWILESVALAKENVYTFNGASIEGGSTKETAELLPAGYLVVAAPVAKRRGVLAGYRMAAVLKEVLGN